MKGFLLRVLYFIIASGILLLMIFILTMKIIEENADFKVDDNVNSLIFGHSHPQCAFNDSIINDVKTYSSSGESYLYTFVKVKQMTLHNPNIKTIFVEYSNNNITEDMDTWIWGNHFLSLQLHLYFPFMQLQDLKLLFENNRRGFFVSTSKAFRQNLKRIVFNNYNYSKNPNVGGYLRLENEMSDSLSEKLDEHHNSTSNIGKLSKMNIFYLEKIVSYCREKQIELFFVRSPQHKSFEYRKNEKVFLAVKDSLFSDIEFLDFNDFPIENEEFADLGHLNYKGAEKFSIFFNNLIKSGVLNIDNKQLFIERKINMLQINPVFAEHDKNTQLIKENI